MASFLSDHRINLNVRQVLSADQRRKDLIPSEEERQQIFRDAVQRAIQFDRETKQP